MKIEAISKNLKERCPQPKWMICWKFSLLLTRYNAYFLTNFKNIFKNGNKSAIILLFLVPPPRQYWLVILVGRVEFALRFFCKRQIHSVHKPGQRPPSSPRFPIIHNWVDVGATNRSLGNESDDLEAAAQIGLGLTSRHNVWPKDWLKGGPKKCSKARIKSNQSSSSQNIIVFGI